MVNPRFSQLLDKARAGDTAAIADLWHEFQFDFYSDVPPSSGSAEGGASC
jgi:hypothetical protein